MKPLRIFDRALRGPFRDPASTYARSARAVCRGFSAIPCSLCAHTRFYLRVNGLVFIKLYSYLTGFIAVCKALFFRIRTRRSLSIWALLILSRLFRKIFKTGLFYPQIILCQNEYYSIL